MLMRRVKEDGLRVYPSVRVMSWSALRRNLDLQAENGPVISSTAGCLVAPRVVFGTATALRAQKGTVTPVNALHKMTASAAYCADFFSSGFELDKHDKVLGSHHSPVKRVRTRARVLQAVVRSIVPPLVHSQFS